MRTGVQELGFANAPEEDEEFENVVEPPAAMDLPPKGVVPLEYHITAGPAGVKSMQIGLDLETYTPYILLISTGHMSRRYIRISPDEFIVLLKNEILTQILCRMYKSRPGRLFDVGGLHLYIDHYNNLRITRGGDQIGFIISKISVERLVEKSAMLRAALVTTNNLALEARALCHEIRLYYQHNKKDPKLTGFKSMTPPRPMKTLLLEEIKCKYLDFIIRSS